MIPNCFGKRSGQWIERLQYTTISPKNSGTSFFSLSQVFNTSALADTLTQADEIADAETDEEMPEVLFNEAISKQEVGKMKSGEKCRSRQDKRRNAKTC